MGIEELLIPKRAVLPNGAIESESIELFPDFLDDASERREEMRFCWPQCTAGRPLTRSATGSLRRLLKKSVFLTVLAE